MSLQGKIAYVAGGTGIIGSGIAVSLLKAGAKVYVSSRDENKIKQLKNSVPEKLREKLVGIRGSPSDEKDISQIKDTILSQDGKIDHVFSSLGGWWQKGKLSDQSLNEFNSQLIDNVTSHFLVYKTFAKDLAKQPGSTYTFITGSGTELFEKNGDDFKFFPDISLLLVGGAGVYGLYNAAKSEFHHHPNLKVSQLRVYIWVRPKDDSNFDPATSNEEVGNDFVGRFAVKIAENHRGGLIRVKSRKEADEKYNNL